MAGTVEKYRKLIRNLLPQGFAWDRVREHPLLEGLAVEFCRVGDRAADLLREIDPNQTTELISDWETMLGIPDECTPTGQSIVERREQIVQKLSVQSNLSIPFYEEIGAIFGFDVTVTNHLSFQVGRSTVRDDLTNYDSPRDVFKVGSGLFGENTVGDKLQVPGWLHYFNIEMPISASEVFEVGQSQVGDKLVDFSNPLLECTYKRLKPAHAGVTFTFS